MTKSRSNTVTTDLSARIKSVDGWATSDTKSVTAAIRKMMLAEVALPNETDIASAVAAEKEAAAGVVYDQRCVLLSVNANPQRTSVMCIVREAAIIDGQVKERNTLTTLAIADAGAVKKLSPAEQAFVEAVQVAIIKFVEA